MGVESTSTYHVELVEWAHQKGWTVFVLNPARVSANNKAMSPTHKNDAVDSWAIAEFVFQKQHLLRPWTPRDPAWRQLRDLTHRRETLTKQRTQELNRREALTKAQEFLKNSIGRVLDFYEQELGQIEAELERLLRTNKELSEQVKLIKTIPGVGPVLAMTLSSEFGRLKEYGKAKDLTAQAGMVPMERSSGSSVRGKSRIKRTGNAKVRRVLFMAAVSAIRAQTWQGWLEQRRANGKDGMDLVMAVMDKLLRLCFGVCKTGLPFNEKIAFGS